MASEKSKPEPYPGVNDAFTFVLPSYQWALERFERNDSRLQQIVAVAASLTVGIPLLAQRVNSNLISDIDFASSPMILAVVLGLGIVVTGLWWKHQRTVILPGLMNIHDNNLRLDVEEFKRSHIYWAGEDQIDNLETIAWKAKGVTLLSYALVLQIVLYSAWIAIGWLTTASPPSSSSPGSLFI